MKVSSLLLASALAMSGACSGTNTPTVHDTNRRASFKVSAMRGPDLVVKSFSWSPAAPVAGQVVTFTAVVANQGNKPTPAGVILGVGYRSSLGTIAFSDTYTASLPAGATVTLVSNRTWTAVAGAYTITATVDDVNRINEKNESNNALALPLTVPSATTASGADLVVTGYSLSPAAPVAGDIVTFTATVKNQGTAATPAGVTLGVSFLNGSGSVIAYADTFSASLAAGASANVVTNKTWSATAGTQTITAFADDVNRIAEANETNNKLAKSVTVGSTSTLPPPSPSPSNAKPAFAFVDSIGINTHFGFPSTPYYSNYPTLRTRLVDLGVKHIRDGGSGDFKLYLGGGVTTIWNELNSYGIKLLLIGRVVWTSADLKSILNANLASIEAVEGQNEGDLFVSGDWVTAVRNWQMMLWNTVKGTSAYSSLPVIAPSVGRIYNYSTLGDLSAYAQHRNVHSYPGGKIPLTSFDTHVTNAEAVAGTKPVYATETGYHSAVQTTNGHLPASERAVAKYLPRLYGDYYNRGVVRTYAYQLYDHIPPSTTDVEANFGLVRYDLTVKPSYNALRNLITVLKDTSASVPGGTLAYQISGANSYTRSLLLQKTSGAYYLLLWQDLSVYDTTNRKDIINPDLPVTLSFDAAKTVTLYKPGVSASPAASYAAASQVSFGIPDEVVVLEIRN